MDAGLTMSDVAALSVVGLETRYGDRKVLRGLSLEIPAGQIYGLLGPNGAGKTTLIRSICGRIAPVAGSITIAAVSNRHRAALRRIGLAPQEIALYPHMTIGENLSVFARLSGLSRKETNEAIDRVAQTAGLARRLPADEHRDGRAPLRRRPRAGEPDVLGLGPARVEFVRPSDRVARRHRAPGR